MGTNLKKRWNEEYEDLDNKYNHDHYDKFLENLTPYIKHKCLDIGCGAGRNLKYIACQKEVEYALGVDFSSNAIEQCKKRIASLKNAECLFCDLFDMQQTDFEFIYDSNTYVHLTDKQKKKYISWLKSIHSQTGVYVLCYAEWLNLFTNAELDMFKENLNLVDEFTSSTDSGNLIIKVFTFN